MTVMATRCAYSLRMRQELSLVHNQYYRSHIPYGGSQSRFHVEYIVHASYRLCLTAVRGSQRHAGLNLQTRGINVCFYAEADVAAAQ